MNADMNSITEKALRVAILYWAQKSRERRKDDPNYDADSDTFALQVREAWQELHKHGKIAPLV